MNFSPSTPLRMEAGYDGLNELLGDERWLRVRIGLHAGMPIHAAGDFIGHDVTLAARIATRACGGEILVSGAARASDRRGAFAFRRLPRAELYGFIGRVQLHRVEWSARPSLALIDPRGVAARTYRTAPPVGQISRCHICARLGVTSVTDQS